jgi:peptidoglycan hydrolase CwlO-like protein
MKLFKNYKKLYKNELENRKALIGQVSKISAENVNYQKEIKKLKEHCARLTIDLEDIDYLLEKTTKERDALKKEKTNLKRELTITKKELNKGGK